MRQKAAAMGKDGQNTSPPPAPAKRPLNSVQNALVGALAGSLEVCIQQPTVAWKNALQSGRPVPRNPLLWYRGLVVNATSIAPITAVQFAGNGIFSSLLSNNGERPLHSTEKIAAAALAGAASALVSCPAELVMIQQQQTGAGLVSTARGIVSGHGVMRLYKGFVPTMGRETVFTACYLGLAGVLSEQLAEQFPTALGESPLKAHLCGSILAGVTAGLLSQPLDTVKTRMQSVLEKSGSSPYRSMPATASELLATSNGSLLIFWKGLLPRAGRICGAVYILGEAGRRLGDAVQEKDILS